MAPDFEKKREPRRVAAGHVGFIQSNSDKGMIFQRFHSNSLSDYYRHGNIGGGSSSSTSTSARTSLTAGNNLSPQATRRFGHQRHQQSRSNQQNPGQQQSQSSQHRSPARIPLASLSGATVRNSDELGASTTNEICDNSNDSGLGFEDRQQHLPNASAWNNGAVGEEDSKRRKMDIKLESEDANFAFPEVTRTSGSTPDTKITRSTSNGVISTRSNGNGSVGRVIGVTRPRSTLNVYGKRPPPAHQGPITLTSQLSSVSRDGKVHLQIICQPEQQHRARYQTEGSRGAVKDRTGNGFPIVRLIGYDKVATLQVFIGTDLGRVAPHMFYQACRVSGKNSTPCMEKKVDGTIVIEVDMDPTKDMLVTCDCVGILKERNVDVEHRFPQEAGLHQGRSKKKSTRCRMVFRTTITLADGTNETLQVCSQPIVCTQPPGIPEISKKSLTSCPCTGGLELFILGKNFLKDTKIVFQLDSEDISSGLEPHWECSVTPDKEFLQQTHLVCVVPPYRRQDLGLSETICVKLYAVSSGKTSEPHNFFYTATSAAPEPSIGKVESATPPLVSVNNDSSSLSSSPVSISSIPSNALIPSNTNVSSNYLTNLPQTSTIQSPPLTQSDVLKNDPSPPPGSTSSQITPVMMWATQAGANCQNNSADVMMPPPNLVANSLINRRSSSNHQLIIPDNLKSEVLDDSSENSMLSDNSLQSMPTPTNSNGNSSTSPLHQLVSDNSRDSSQNGMLQTVSSLPGNQESSVGLLGVDLMHNSMSLTSQTSPFSGMHEQSQVKVLTPRHINKETNPILPSDSTSTSTHPGVVDLRMKQHEYDTLTNFTTTPVGQPLPNQNSRCIEKYLNHIESNTSTNKTSENQENNFVDSLQQRASIIASTRAQQQANILAPNQETVKLDELVNSAVDSHQMPTPMQTIDTTSNSLMNEVDGMTSPQQNTRTSPSSIPVKTMLLEALLPSTIIPSTNSTVSPAAVNVVPESTAEENLMTTINATLHPTLQETSIVTVAGLSNGTVSVNSHNPSILQVTSEPIQQIQGMSQQDVMQQQVQQVEQVVAHAQQQVEQVVAQVQQQAANTVQHAQQQVVQQVVQHTHVVQQAVQQVQAAQQVQAVPAVQQAVEQATNEVVQQAVQQATHEVVQQVQAVQQAVQQAQAAQAMQHAVQQDIGSMLNQPAGFVAEASTALANGASQEPSQQELTNAAEKAINTVIENATRQIFNNQPLDTTTANAIIATKNILNSVATQSAQLMNCAMEGILPKSPSASGNIVEQVSRKSPPVSIPVTPNRQANEAVITNQATNSNGQVPVARKPEDAGVMLPQELTSMSEHDLLSYINPSCFDQSTFLM